MPENGKSGTSEQGGSEVDNAHRCLMPVAEGDNHDAPISNDSPPVCRKPGFGL